MISQVIRQIQSDDWYNISSEVEIAKGRYKLDNRLKTLIYQFKRVLRGNKIYR